MHMAYRCLMMPRFLGESIGESAFSLGFENETIFTRAFKKYFGLTPREVIQIQRVASLEPESTPHRTCEHWLRALYRSVVRCRFAFRRLERRSLESEVQ